MILSWVYLVWIASALFSILASILVSFILFFPINDLVLNKEIRFFSFFFDKAKFGLILSIIVLGKLLSLKILIIVVRP